MLSGCGLVGGADTAEPAATSEAAELTGPTSTPVTLAPTLGAQPTATATPQATVTPMPTAVPTDTEEPEETTTGGTPTPLPGPTRIGTQEDEEGEETPSATRGSTQPGISISPQLGEPGDVTKVDGDGFEPGETVSLYWVAPGSSTATGTPYYELDADDEGSFTVDLIVLPAERWPGGPPQDGDEIQLQAVAPSLDGGYYYANFKKLTHEANTALALTYESEDYGYQIQVLNGWEWDWQNDDTSNVRFSSASGSGSGFVRVENGTNVDALIPTVMGEEFPGQTYTTGLLGAGSYPGTQATLENGRTVQFIPSGGQTYVLSFVSDSGQPLWNVIGSFTLD